MEFEAPSCPDDAPNVVFEGHPEPGPLSCGTCSCEAPPGTCSLPDKWTVSSAACNLPGVNTNFNPPANWDGDGATNTQLGIGTTVITDTGADVAGTIGGFAATGIPNPNFRKAINDPGRRFKVDDSTGFDAWISATVMF